MVTARMLVSPQARLTYLAISSIIRNDFRLLRASPRGHHRRTSSRSPHYRSFSSARCLRNDDRGSYHRSDFTSTGWTGVYEANAPTSGPLSSSSLLGTPRITPRILYDHLSAFVVGQERAKRVLATAVYNHYQRIQELQRRDEEEQEHAAQEERRRVSELRRHPVEGREHELKRGIEVPSLTRSYPAVDVDEFPGQTPTINMPAPGATMGGSRKSGEEWVRYSPIGGEQRSPGFGVGPGPPPPPLMDNTPLTIEKSNILLLGPSGVGKTLMAKTLARVLEVPFSMSDCTPFTQAGYIGEDAEVCVQRLLAAANYDVPRAERGIICLDEIDKIATAKVSHGKDVSGEGVQQALLKIIEGTTLQIQAKQERGAVGGSPGTTRSGGSGGGMFGGSTSSPLSGGSISSGSQSPGTNSSGGGGGGSQKGEVYNVRTDNILFICAGAFNGLHKMILDRISKGSIGFGATVRAAPGNSASKNEHETILEGEDELFEKHLPYYDASVHTASLKTYRDKKQLRRFNTLDLVEPQDLQKYGLIPELVGRIPISCALSSLDIEALVKVLTEPRNSLLEQYKQSFALSSIELRVTSPALRVIATTASKMGTGARGLRTVMERLLADAMFETPGSPVKYVLITEAVAEKKCGALYFGRGEHPRFQAIVMEEEERWEEEVRRRKEESEEGLWEKRGRINREGGAAKTFEEYRVKAAAAGI